ncbi:NAD(P)-dependent oxidoreductase [Klebsiella sp. BIGb0407]|uniref:NAD(P)-dependent oxidoreductase n=1 Tax=Klebsiella sp. BIGb0407 TaxID=2940603 RepID=UPI0021695CE3|nr:NAD(P)-dependent oxidoreductase [Klebsiella sp. BIGb0407]MCS3432216.1 D-3-phosphoglycerate dehydrogenase [Klebsiella sp. BIGb0407]
MKIVICDHKESLDRDVSAEIKLFKDMLGEKTHVIVHEYDGDNEKLKEVISDADGVMTSYVSFTDEIISSSRKLKAISINATGYNFIDLASAHRNNVKIAVISEYCTQEVSEHAFSLALAVARNLKKYSRSIDIDKKYSFNCVQGMFRLEGATFGIMGLGKIGRSVARKAQGFGMKVIAFSPSCPESAASELDITLVDKQQLFRESNFICLTMSLNKGNTRILDHEAFAMMEKKPIIVNVSRGQMIDENALIYALDNNLIFGAGLDVLVDESDQYIATSPLTERDNVILTPHAAFYSDFSMQENQRIGVSNLVNILTNKIDKVARIVS